MRKISADIVFPVSGPPIPNGVVVVDQQGFIQEVISNSGFDQNEVEHYHGAIIPGLINAHCHLELSHMKGRVDTGTQLLPFLQAVVSLREVPEEEILEAIRRADEEMVENGIVAVGDISNKLDTAPQKAISPIRYYTFVEMFDFMQNDWAQREFEKYLAVYHGHSDQQGNAKSCVPHAPYTVSDRLYKLINTVNKEAGSVSIHMQETPAENELFQSKSGGFIDFYRSFNISLDDFSAKGTNSIRQALPQLDPRHRTLLVHNTMSGPSDIEYAEAWSNQVYWVTCPNANLYIENRLPNYRHFLDAGAKVALGTDSLTSNWCLSILEEMKTIRRYQSYVPLEELVRWATLNGAEALGFEDSLGSIEKGKQPGLNLITLNDQGDLDGDSQLSRLV